ncbi:MAG: hypothetical protein ACE5OP_00950 [Candidatus Glassbacteria bacterium]
MKKYKIEGKKELIHLLSRAIRDRVEKEGFNIRVHLSEPIHEATVFEYEKDAGKIVITLDDGSLGGSNLTVESEEVDTFAVVHSAAIDVIAGLIDMYLKPMVRDRDRMRILERIRDLVEKAVRKGK